MSPFVHPVFWSDPEIEAASAEVKLTVLWLITNSQTTIIGLCRATPKRFAFETGLPESALLEAVDKLPKMLVKGSDGIWIRNYIHHQFGRGEKLIKNNCFKSIGAAFAQVQNDKLKDIIVGFYPELQALHKPSQSPLEGFSRGKVRVREGEENESEEERAKREKAVREKREAELNAMAVRVGGWFNRRPNTAWSRKEKQALESLHPFAEEDTNLLERYYAAVIPQEKDYRRKDVPTLLNNWPGEIDRARKFFVGMNGHHPTAKKIASAAEAYGT